MVEVNVFVGLNNSEGIFDLTLHSEWFCSVIAAPSCGLTSLLHRDFQNCEALNQTPLFGPD